MSSAPSGSSRSSHGRPVDDGAGQSDALLLAAGELGRTAGCQVCQLNQLQCLLCLGLGVADLSGA